VGSPRKGEPERLPRVAALGLAALLLAAAAPGKPTVGDGRLRPILGERRSAMVGDGDTLLDIAYRDRLGYQAVARLNPGVDVWVPEPGTILQLPTQFVLPDVTEEGVVINVPEMRLFDFTVEDGPQVLAVAVGDAADPTILGDFRVGQKRVDPVWNVPKSIREEKPELPAQVPPGPDNPLGKRWMTIGNSSYGVHGTNVRWSIGREATHGCVRLYEDQIERLYERIPQGTRLQLVYQPYKWGTDGRFLYFEAHPDLYGLILDHLATALAAPRALGLLDAIDLERVWNTLEEARGIPVRVGRLLPARVKPDEGATS
jgi:L,D-transpeptidase ErfK/SrfK